MMVSMQEVEVTVGPFIIGVSLDFEKLYEHLLQLVTAILHQIIIHYQNKEVNHGTRVKFGPVVKMHRSVVLYD